MIKLDIINHVVDQTGITRPKAEMAVDSVFNAMKNALRFHREKLRLVETLGLGRKFLFRQEKQFGLSQVKVYRQCSLVNDPKYYLTRFSYIDWPGLV